jgi:predicted RNase H-like HicB family nuclease
VSKTWNFEILMEPEGDGFHVWCPALKGCRSSGLTLDEARENIADAIRGWLRSADELGYSIPEREIIQIRRPQ